MKVPALLIVATLAVSSCESTSVSQTGSDPAREPKISFEKKGLFDSRAGLFLRIDGQDHLIVEGISRFDNLKPVHYNHTGIPSYADIAGQYWFSEREGSERHIVYADYDRRRVEVYSTRYRPGRGSDSGWQSLGSFPY